MLENATRICEAEVRHAVTFDGKEFHFGRSWYAASTCRIQPASGPFQRTPGGMVDRVMRTKQVSHMRRRH